MEKVDILKPIEKKIEQWIFYESNEPKGNKKLQDNFRKQHDLDCQLTNGNLKADTIFSLWLPLRFTLRELNDYNIYIPNKKTERDRYLLFLEKLGNDLPDYLPSNNYLVKKLSKLFELGMKRENVMILPYRIINIERGSEPYYDYMPHFLYECFRGGYFSKYFNNDYELVEWLETQHLKMLFGVRVGRFNIKDLSGSGSVKDNRPKNVGIMMDNYIDILKARKVFYQIENN